MPPNTANTAIAISTIDLLLALSLAMLLGLIVALVYRITHRGMNYERSFLVTLVMIGPIVALVMMMIGSSLTLSLGLVGALSIVRFRTVIKDTRDMVYLFWMIAIGLGCGTTNWQAVAIATGFIGVGLLSLNFMKYGHRRHSDYVLVMEGLNEPPMESITQHLGTHASRFELRSMETKDDRWEVVFELRTLSDKVAGEQELVADFKKMAGIERVSLLAPQLTLPL
jgi:uncharacterized membrane protein YhiD involved in acid resistance